MQHLNGPQTRMAIALAVTCKLRVRAFILSLQDGASPLVKAAFPATGPAPFLLNRPFYDSAVLAKESTTR